MASPSSPSRGGGLSEQEREKRAHLYMQLPERVALCIDVCSEMDAEWGPAGSSRLALLKSTLRVSASHRPFEA
jgi:hypothetical protein